MTSESHNTRLGRITQDFQGFKSGLNSLLFNLKTEIQLKFENLNSRVNQIESNLESNITEQMNESIFSIKDSIITALRDGNKMLLANVEILEKN